MSDWVVILAGGGVDVDVTPELRLSVNVNHLGFVDTAVLENLRQEGSIPKSLGWDASVSAIWLKVKMCRPSIRASGRAAVIEFAEERRGEVRRSVLDPRKAQEALGEMHPHDRAVGALPQRLGQLARRTEEGQLQGVRVDPPVRRLQRDLAQLSAMGSHELADLGISHALVAATAQRESCCA